MAHFECLGISFDVVAFAEREIPCQASASSTVFSNLREVENISNIEASVSEPLLVCIMLKECVCQCCLMDLFRMDSFLKPTN